MLNWQWDNTVSYKTLIKEKHRISAVLGANMSYYGQNWNSLDVKGFGNDFFSYKAIAGASDMYTIVAIMSRLQVVMMVHLNSEPIINGDSSLRYLLRGILQERSSCSRRMSLIT